MTCFIENSVQLLRQGGHKITGPRRAVLGVLAQVYRPLSAYDIQRQIPKNIPTNVVTIYRVLDLFEKLGIVHKIHTKEGYVKCDFESQGGCHLFAVCRECGRTDEFVQKKCKIKRLMPSKLTYKSLSHISEMAGMCAECL